LYSAARIGDFVVNRNTRPTSSRWAIIFVSAAVLALAGCGRKGPLELPPTASVPPAASAQADADAQRAASKPSVFDPTYGSEAPPAAPKGAKKAFVLDPLLKD
jgi:predicted small lipoprotein YifL